MTSTSASGSPRRIAAAEITLNELRIELSYPLDHATDDFFRQPQRQ